MLEKKELRAQIKDERKKITILQKEQKNKAIFTALINTDAYKTAKCILTYISTSDEVDTYKFINYALNEGKCIAAPISDYSNCTMQFVKIDSADSLFKAKYGIYEPAFNEKNLVTDYSDCICIVPGLAFDLSGNRLGYGKGFYDRFLKEFNQNAIGLCYDCFLWKQLGTDIYDVPVDTVITDNRIVNTKAAIELECEQKD